MWDQAIGFYTDPLVRRVAYAAVAEDEKRFLYRPARKAGHFQDIVDNVPEQFLYRPARKAGPLLFP